MNKRTEALLERTPAAIQFEIKMTPLTLSGNGRVNKSIIDLLGPIYGITHDEIVKLTEPVQEAVTQFVEEIHKKKMENDSKLSSEDQFIKMMKEVLEVLSHD